MTGTSSAFFASIAEKTPITRKLIPQYYYWPIEKPKKRKKTKSYLIGDGGCLENYGLLPLLQRQVDHIIIFINSETAINNPHQHINGEWRGIDSYLPPLFGQHSEFWQTHQGKPTTQVFKSELFQQLVTQFQQCIKQGSSVTAFTDWPVSNNHHFNIVDHRPDGKPYRVKILWFYNNRAKQWEQQLPQSLQELLNKEISNPFPHFPNYSTIDEDFDLFNIDTWNDWGGLTKQQVNLLAHFSAWNVLQQKDYLKQLF